MPTESSLASANDFLKVSGIKNRSDGDAGCFLNKADTGIPRLREYVDQTTARRREAATHAILRSDPTARNKTPAQRLFDAALVGNLDRVTALLQQGVDANAVDAYGTTPLIAAARGGHHRISALLIASGADPDKADLGGTPLHAAVRKVHPEIVRLLLLGHASPDRLDRHGRLPIDAIVPAPEDFQGGKVEAAKRSLEYMGLTAGTPLSEIEIDTVFIGSCTNGRIEDLRAAAAILKGKKIKEGLRAMVVPGSGLVRAQAEEEGLADIFKDAGFEWRLAGCSMCLAMNPDQLSPGERCAATSNRNFEGRQGRGGRTHLMSPAMAAAAAVTGKLTDVRQMM